MINGSSQKNEDSSRNMPTMIHPPRLGSEMSAVEVNTTSKCSGKMDSNSKHEDPEIVYRMGVDVFVWGLNEGGQLGILSSKSALIPRQILEVPFTPVKVSCGAEHSLFLSSTG
jgi:alpha-tubulin suppressor-like RCC1 family protein